MTSIGALPRQIQPQTVPFGRVDADGRVFVDINWYLFLYNLSNQVLGSNSGSTVPASPVDLIAFIDQDAANTDIAQAYRQIANAILMAIEPPLADPQPQAQPSAAVTVTASPFTYAVPFNGCVSITGGTVSLIQIIRQGVTVGTGITSGLVPVSKFDRVVITYTVAPTVVFLPT